MKIISLATICLFILAACGGDADPLPTLASDANTEQTSSDTSSTSQTDTSSESDVIDLTLEQTIDSQTGVTYQLPASWVVQDNESVSNFSSDESAILDSLSAEKNNSRWMMLGNIGTSNSDRIMALMDVSNFEEASTTLHEYFYTADYDLTPPTIITLNNGKQASFTVGTNENREGWASAVYFIEGDDTNFINFFIEARQDILLENLDFIRAVAESVNLR